MTRSADARRWLVGLALFAGLLAAATVGFVLFHAR